MIGLQFQSQKTRLAKGVGAATSRSAVILGDNVAYRNQSSSSLFALQHFSCSAVASLLRLAVIWEQFGSYRKHPVRFHRIRTAFRDGREPSVGSVMSLGKATDPAPAP